MIVFWTAIILTFDPLTGATGLHHNSFIFDKQSDCVSHLEKVLEVSKNTDIIDAFCINGVPGLNV